MTLSNTSYKSLNGTVRDLAAGKGNYKSSTATSVTLTAAELVDGFFDQTGGTTNTVTTPTAAAIVAAIPGCQVGSQFDFTVKNSGSGTLTVAGGTGVTMSGTATVATTVTTGFKAVVVNATAGTEAITIVSFK